ncbi:MULTISPECIES: NADPH-dependent F420 reductase [unclassified Hyphomicrobium]|uniref:NADPH-dependent F420 reductase n=1 Tax=unclassified Hyphomicrobium TaxID=2619925 RepID=UPI000213F4A7|nr:MULTISPECIES: NADPH-dependent F420 reductase [unclassified Hyphomicrobium]CCB66761.1 NADPH-dependent F420 reductase [Hyphomicrobium sp. MC1]
MANTMKPTIGIIGGTGDLGSGLAKVWAAAGYKVIVGSRSKDKAEASAAEIGHGVTGLSNGEAAATATIIVLTIPFSNHASTIAEIKDAAQGKIVIDATVPLVPPKVSTVQLPVDGSAAQISQRLFGDGVRVVSAFHNVGAKKLHSGGRADCDVLVFSDDKNARSTVVELAGVVARRGVAGGALANSAAAEAMTSVLIWINRQYKVPSAGIGITGLEANEAV